MITPRPARGLLGIAMVLIFYGSLLPFSFSLPPNAFFITNLPHRAELPDVVLNVALYLPVGFLAFCSFRKPRLAYAILVGFALSFTVEFLQAFDIARYSSLTDLAGNTLGTALGACLPRFFRNLSDRPAPLALIAIAIAAALYPFHSPTPFRSDEVFFFAVNWLAVRVALTVVLKRPDVNKEFALLLLVIAVHASVADFIGALLALSIGAVVNLRPQQLAPVMLLSLVVRELEPFRFSGPPQPFQWIPFATSLEGTLGGPVTFLNKAFLYGGVQWLFDPEARLTWRITLPLAALLALLEWTQCYLPGRTPELTDPVMVLIAGYALSISCRTDDRCPSSV